MAQDDIENDINTTPEQSQPDGREDTETQASNKLANGYVYASMTADKMLQAGSSNWPMRVQDVSHGHRAFEARPARPSRGKAEV
ncbi:hypothetical protein F503_05406 [Ophiostoma piceae UAMH 11346]|uniref:Uncharacterized protein n=1 Tax=Ophiostoma piceae (strain UAMH 11346) TaxID=1262450 RepID=S3CE37_OPHP1|nr:hypothetical protein F503_05406 [Ophiostoma piceae UAMH 11346]